MSSYLLRLASQSGMKLGRGMTSVKPASPNAQPGLALPAPLTPPDGIEQNAPTEISSPPPLSTHAPHTFATPAHPSTENLRTASTDAPNHPSQIDPRSGVASAIGSQVSHVARDAPSETQPKGEAEAFHRVPATLPGTAVPPHSSPDAREPTATEVIQEVMTWIANDSASANIVPVEALASSRSASLPDFMASVPLEANAAAASETASVSKVQDKTARLSPVARETEPGSTSVHIGSIHLTIEAPPETAPRISPTPAPVAAPRTIGSRLRRHYLRPF